jgi:hypothetical protein
MWKAMAPAQLNALPSNPAIGYLMSSNNANIGEDEKELENILRDKISSKRRHESNLQSSWDSQMSYLLSTALANYEYERIGK